MDVTIREQRLPGVGQRYEFDLNDDRRLIVIAILDGGRWVGVAEGETDDVPMLELSPEQATMLGALLLGAHFSIDVADDPHVAGDTVIVETVTVPDGAPGVGRRAAELLAGAPEPVQVLGVIRDHAPEVVETDHDAPLRPGDQVAIAARADQVGAVRDILTGGTGTRALASGSAG